MGRLRFLKVAILRGWVLCVLVWGATGSLATETMNTNKSVGPQWVEGALAQSALPRLLVIGQETKSDNSTSVEEGICSACHEQAVQDFAGTVHGKAWRFSITTGIGKGLNGARVSCQTCHGDASAHVAEGDPTKIFNPAKAKPVEASQTCLKCHSQMNEHALWRGSKHESAGLSCLSCHTSHHAPIAKFNESQLLTTTQAEVKQLKMRTEAETCYQCHGNVRKSQFQRSTHLFRNEDRENHITCSSCHEPHGSIGEKMMRTASVNETCYTCHVEKRGPYLWEHAPVRESCANCHRSHGSNNIALLTKRTPMLCQQCHIQGRHQTIAGRPNSVFTTNRSCSNCHAQVHGSNHPSGINLQR